MSNAGRRARQLDAHKETNGADNDSNARITRRLLYLNVP